MHCFAVNDIARHCGYYADTESLRSTVTALHCTSLEASCLCWGYDILGHLIEVKSGAEFQNSRSPKSFVRIQGSKMCKRSIDLFKTFQKQLVELWPTVVPVAWSQHMPKLFREKPSFFWEADKRRGNHVWQLHLDCLRIHLIHLPSGKNWKATCTITSWSHWVCARGPRTIWSVHYAQRNDLLSCAVTRKETWLWWMCALMGTHLCCYFTSSRVEIGWVYNGN